MCIYKYINIYLYINRSLDFAKASGNVALTPSLETFDLSLVLMTPLNVIKHLQVECQIVIDPLWVLPLHY
jgi:hypothetical protein